MVQWLIYGETYDNRLMIFKEKMGNKHTYCVRDLEWKLISYKHYIFQNKYFVCTK